MISSVETNDSVCFFLDEELDLPVKRNQAYIIKYFSKTREKFCDHILGRTGTNDTIDGSCSWK